MKTLILLSLFILNAKIYAAETASEIFNTYSPTVVLIQTKYNASGTGFFVTPGLILTNRHVVRSYNARAKKWDSPKVIILKDGYEISKFNSIYCSKRVDVCAISVTPQPKITKFSKLSIASSRVGQDVFVVGHPQGINNPIISSGIISSESFLVPAYDFRGKDSVFKGFTTTAPISHGSSGSPVLNNSGEIMGIAVSILSDAQNLNVIIGSEELSMFAKQIAKKDASSVFTIKTEVQTSANLVSLK